MASGWGFLGSFAGKMRRMPMPLVFMNFVIRKETGGIGWLFCRGEDEKSGFFMYTRYIIFENHNIQKEYIYESQKKSVGNTGTAG